MGGLCLVYSTNMQGVLLIPFGFLFFYLITQIHLNHFNVHTWTAVFCPVTVYFTGIFEVSSGIMTSI